ncbi:magnesium/cobalt transporter CorA [Candidatus Bipolaricaulota bacterium]|nr:magnesium/cobalt transporter CorA [Candidatus Bipolaricaulota bacterium]
MKGYLFYPNEPEPGIQVDEALENFESQVNQQGVSFWIDVEGDDFESEVKRVGDRLDLHPLTIEDVLTTESRPIVDTFQDYLYILARTPAQDWEIGEMQTFQLSMVLGSNFLLTFHRKNLPATQNLKDKITRNPERYFGRGVDFLCYYLLDGIADDYYPVLDRLEEEIGQVEDEVLTDPNEELLMKISNLRSDLIEIQRTAGPQRETAAKLARSDTQFITDDRKVYFRDIQDNLVRIFDLLTNYRDLIGMTRDMYMTSISNRMNEIMKTLTIVATIFIPLTFIAGVYGMNFEIMPELSWDWGYYGALGIMGATALGMVYYFRKKDWL